MAGKRLSNEEKNKILSKLRREYDNLQYELGAPKSLKQGFEDRYIDALRSRTDLTTFLSAEISVIKELKNKNSEKKDAGEKKSAGKKGSKKSFADRVLEKLTARIKAYPHLPIHPDAAEEIEYLFGALDRFEKVYWAQADSIFRNFFPRELSFTRTDLDNSMLNLVSRMKGRPPITAERYITLLNDRYSDESDLTREVKRSLTEAAFFFHRFIVSAKAVLEREDLTQSDRMALKKAYEEAKRIIKDFRLGDLKPPAP